MERVNTATREKIKERLIPLIEKAGNKTSFGKSIGVSRDTVNNWLLDKSDIRLNDLVNISQVYAISVDYLLGLSHVASSDPAVADVCKYTGLSEYAVMKLHSVSFDEQSKAFISRLITEYGKYSPDVFEYISGAIYSQKLISSEAVNVLLATHVKANGANPQYYDSVPDGAEVLPAKEARDYKLSEAARCFRELLKDFVSGFKFEPLKPAPPNGSSFNDYWGYGPKQTK